MGTMKIWRPLRLKLKFCLAYEQYERQNEIFVYVSVFFDFLALVVSSFSRTRREFSSRYWARNKEKMCCDVTICFVFFLILFELFFV